MIFDAADQWISDINPLECPKLIWNYVEKYMASYNVTFAEMKPDTVQDKTVVVWRILRRTPGAFDNKNRKYFRWEKAGITEDGRVHSVWMAYFECIVEYAIFSKSSSIIDELGWNLEMRILEANGPIAKQYPGFRIEFLEQTNDSYWPTKRPEEDLRTIRFKVSVPVRADRFETAMTGLSIKLFGDQPIVVDQPVVQTLPTTFSFPNTSGNLTRSIIMVKRPVPSSTQRQLLLPGVDYQVSYSPTQGGSFITWLENGSVPAIGETFWITYIPAIEINDINIR